MALAPMDLKYQSRYQNEFSGSGGASTIHSTVSRASSNRNAARTTASSTLSGNVYFKPSNRGLTQIRYMSGRNAAIGMNYHRARGQQFGFNIDNFWRRPTVSKQQAVVQQPKASWGQELAQAVASGVGLFGALKDAGLVKGNNGSSNTGATNGTTKPQGAKTTVTTNSNSLQSALESTFGDKVGDLTGNNRFSPAGLPTAATLGVGFDSRYSSVESMIKDMTDPAAAKTAVTNLVTQSSADFYSAQALQDIYSSQLTNLSTQEEKLSNAVKDADVDAENYASALEKEQDGLNEAKSARNSSDKALADSHSDYQQACTNVTNAENAVTSCQNHVSTCNTELGIATSKLKSAKANYDNAKAKYESMPSDAPGKAAAESLMQQAEAAKKQAETDEQNARKNLTSAEAELKKAQQDLTNASKAKTDKLEEYKETDKKNQQLIEQCINEEKAVKEQQSKYDKAKVASDKSKQKLAEAQSDVRGFEQMKLQNEQLQAKMKTLQDNMKKANKLQEKCDKAASNYFKKHKYQESPDNNSQQENDKTRTDMENLIWRGEPSKKTPEDIRQDKISNFLSQHNLPQDTTEQNINAILRAREPSNIKNRDDYINQLIREFNSI